MAIEGQKREQKDFAKKVGMFQASVIAINPDAKSYEELLGITLQDDSKATEYLGESKEGNTTLRVNIWLEDTATGWKTPVSFYLEDKERENKDLTKKQYINSNGTTTWVDSPNNLPDWFLGSKDSPRDYRVAYVGEDELYGFVTTWMGGMDPRSRRIDLEFKKLMRGNFTPLQELIGCEYATPVVAMATVKIKDTEEGTKEYQAVYNKGFLGGYALKLFKNIDYSDPKQISLIREKEKKNMKGHEKFILDVTGEYGCKDCYYLGPLKEYNPDDFLVASNEVISSDGADF